jgi:hypothetical protein
MSADRSTVDLDGLPGADLVIDGVADLRAGKDTAYAALVLTAAPRLREIGIAVPDKPSDQPSSHRLYELLSREDAAGAYGRYNALLGRMASFANAAEQRAAQR